MVIREREREREKLTDQRILRVNFVVSVFKSAAVVEIVRKEEWES